MENFNCQILSAKVAKASLEVVAIVSRGGEHFLFCFPSKTNQTNPKEGTSGIRNGTKVPPLFKMLSTIHTTRTISTENNIEIENVLVSVPKQWTNICKLELWNYHREETGCYKF